MMTSKGDEMNFDPGGNYAEVNGLRMYYEVHGTGEPLVVLHGAYMTIDSMGELVPGLARGRQVIAVELQGHGRTADVDRPLSYEQMADDTAALLRHLGVERADYFCYSFGGGVALQLAVRHPGLVRKLVLTGGVAFSPAGLYPEVLAGLGSMTHEVMVGTPWYEAYTRIAPRPEDFPTLFA